MAAKKRRIIFNNDGCDAYYCPTNVPPTPEGLISVRTPSTNTQVDTISYCTLDTSFGIFTYRTKIGDFADKPRTGSSTYNLVSELAEQNTDPIQVLVDWAGANNKEIFWSMRMNDTHDSAHTPQNPYPFWSTLKQNHPEPAISASTPGIIWLNSARNIMFKFMQA